jgi:hypothetical protein
MGRRYGLNRYVFKTDHAIRLKMPYIVEYAERMTFYCGIKGLLGDIQGEAVFSLKDACMPDMIAMIMGNDYGIDIADRAPPGRKLFFCLNSVYTRIEEERYVACLNIDAVSIAAGLQRKCYHDGVIIRQAGILVNILPGREC